MATLALERRLASLSLKPRVCPSCTYRSTLIHRPSRRNASWVQSNDPSSQDKTPSTQTAEDYAKKAPSTRAAERARAQSLMAVGTESSESIFNDDAAAPKKGKDGKFISQDGKEIDPNEDMDADALRNVTDPQPWARRAWQRRQVVKSVRKRGVLTKAEILKRTERECSVRSQSFKTSTKKMMHLARQIAGKPVDEAIVQMQFSKKRVAQDIRKHLEYARDMATVSRGMGLGKAQNKVGKPLQIELKGGKRKTVTDRTEMYVDQAWVNKGFETSSMDFRGRGRVFKLTHRRARITVLLKEEATRVRLSEEIQKKRDNRKLWLHLPDRPITLQRQYPLW